MQMTPTDVLAIVGAVTGIIGTTAGLLALGWDIHKWKYSKPLLKPFFSKDMTVDKEGYYRVQNPSHPHFVVGVTNVGQSNTTLVSIELVYYKSRFMKWVDEDEYRIIFERVKFGRLPYLIEPGKQWVAAIPQDPRFVHLMEKGHLFNRISALSISLVIICRCF